MVWQPCWMTKLFVLSSNMAAMLLSFCISRDWLQTKNCMLVDSEYCKSGVLWAKATESTQGTEHHKASKRSFCPASRLKWKSWNFSYVFFFSVLKDMQTLRKKKIKRRLRAVLLFPSDHASKAPAKLCKLEKRVSRLSRLRRSLHPSRATKLGKRKRLLLRNGPVNCFVRLCSNIKLRFQGVSSVN